MADDRNTDGDVRLVDYLYEEMDSEERKSFEDALKRDEALARDAEDLRRVVDLYRSQLMEEEVSPAVQARVLEVAARRSARASIWDRLAALVALPVRRYAIGVAMSVLVVCGAVVAVYKLKGRPVQERPTARGPVARSAEYKKSEMAQPRPEATPPAELAEAHGARDEAPPRLDSGNVDGDDDEGVGKAMPSDSVSTMSFVSGEKARRPASGKKRAGGTVSDRRVSSKVTLALEGRYKRNRKRPHITVREKRKTRGKRGWAKNRGDAADGFNTRANRSVGAASGGSTQQRLYRTGIVLQQKGKHRQAINYFSQATAGYARKDAVLIRWAESEMKLGNYGRAEKLLAMVKGRTKEAKAEKKKITRRIRLMKTRRLARVQFKAAAQRAAPRARARARPRTRARARQAARPVPQAPPRKK